MFNKVTHIIPFILSAAFSVPTHAVIQGVLDFMEPTGIVEQGESIELWVTLTLDESSDPIIRGSNVFPFGVDLDIFPAGAHSFETDQYESFASYDYVYPFFFNGCSSLVCYDSGVYEPQIVIEHENSWVNFSGEINPGEGRDFLLFYLNPKNSNIPIGEYSLYDVGIGMIVAGTDQNGLYLSEELYYFDTACYDESCGLSRTVVPLPASVWLFITGLAVLVGMKSRENFLK